MMYLIDLPSLSSLKVVMHSGDTWTLVTGQYRRSEVGDRA